MVVMSSLADSCKLAGQSRYFKLLLNFRSNCGHPPIAPMASTGNVSFREIRLASRPRTQGVKRVAPSKFVEDAVKWRLFDRTVSEVRSAFSDMSADELNETIGKALATVREKRRDRKAMR